MSTVFHTQVFKVDDHIEVLKLNATRFKNWIRRTTYQEDSVVIDTSTLNDIIGILSAEAEFNPECPTINLALRVANIDDSWYYDLTNKQWEFIQITPRGLVQSTKRYNIPQIQHNSASRSN